MPEDIENAKRLLQNEIIDCTIYGKNADNGADVNGEIYENYKFPSFLFEKLCYNIICWRRGMAQLVARCVRDAEAVSSSLTTPTNVNCRRY